MPKELVLFYPFLLTVPLYIQCYKLVHYCPDHNSNTISSGALNFYAVFKNVTSEPLDHCEFFDPQSCYCIPPYQTKNNLKYL